MTITGSGYKDNNTTVLIGGFLCEVIDLNYYQIICTTVPRHISGIEEVVVSFSNNCMRIVFMVSMFCAYGLMIIHPLPTGNSEPNCCNM